MEMASRYVTRPGTKSDRENQARIGPRDDESAEAQARELIERKILTESHTHDVRQAKRFERSPRLQAHELARIEKQNEG